MTFLQKKIPRSTLMGFYWHLHYCLKAGLDIEQALKAFDSQSLSPMFRRDLVEILKKYKQGHLLSTVFDRPSFQDRSMVRSLLKAAESSGQYMQVFAGLAEYQAWKIDMQAKMLRLLSYPLFMVVVGLALLGVTLFVLIPDLYPLLKEMVEDQPTHLDGLYQFVMWCNRNTTLLLVGLFGPIIGVGVLLKFSRKMRIWFQQKLFLWPPFSKIIRVAETVQFSQIMHLLLVYDVRLVTGLKQISVTHPWSFCQDTYKKVQQKITGGQSLSEAFSEAQLFAPLFNQVLLAGEVSGNLVQSLQHASTYFDQIFKRKIDSLLRIIPLVVLGGVGCILVFILVQVILPLYSVAAMAGGQA